MATASTTLAGEDERGGYALLYFGVNEPLALVGSEREYPSSGPKPYIASRRRLNEANPNEVVTKQDWLRAFLRSNKTSNEVRASVYSDCE